MACGRRSLASLLEEALARLKTGEAGPAEARGAEGVGDGMLSVAEAVELSRLSRSELYAAMSDGRLRYAKVGKRRLVLRRSLLEMLGRNVVPSN